MSEMKFGLEVQLNSDVFYSVFWLPPLWIWTTRYREKCKKKNFITYLLCIYTCALFYPDEWTILSILWLSEYFAFGWDGCLESHQKHFLRSSRLFTIQYLSYNNIYSSVNILFMYELAFTNPLLQTTSRRCF